MLGNRERKRVIKNKVIDEMSNTDFAAFFRFRVFFYFRVFFVTLLTFPFCLFLFFFWFF
jgi:hypothetical protein